MTRLRALATSALVVLLLLVPISVWAHAEIVLASPGPGIGLAQAPAAVVIKLSEPLNVAVSRIEVLDGSGTDVASGMTDGVPGDEAAMQRELGLLEPGPYTVRWTSVSALDGHVLRGSYRFGVGTATSGEETVAAGPLDSEGPLGLLGRYLVLAGLPLWAGVVMLVGVARRAGVPAQRIQRLSRLAPLLVAAGGSLALVSSSLVISGGLDALPGLASSSSGQLRGGMVAAAALGVLLGMRWRIIAGLLALAALLAEAASGHAAASTAPLVASATFALHLGSVGVWIFSIFASLIAPGRVREALAAFAPYAITSAAVVGLTGIASSVYMLADPGDLVTTEYGLVVLLKGFVFVMMATLGVTHHLWRRDGSVPAWRLRLPLRGEASSALLAVGLATILVGFPNPPREAEAAERFVGSDQFLDDLATTEALSVAEAEGDLIVGLTLTPPGPGRVRVHVNVLGLEPADAPRDARFIASGSGGEIDEPLSSCGLGCFDGTASIPGADRVTIGVRLVTNRGRVDTSTEVVLPAADGSGLYAEVFGAMESLRSVEMDEVLRASQDGEAYQASYAFAAPDAMSLRAGDTERVVIGGSDFRRADGGSWETWTWPGPPFTWPGSYYREFWAQAAAPRVIGEDEIDGVPLRVLSFVRTDLPAWFRLWIGPDDRVRRAVMLAQGHLMDQRFRNFDKTPAIAPPLDVPPSP